MDEKLEDMSPEIIQIANKYIERMFNIISH